VPHHKQTRNTREGGRSRGGGERTECGEQTIARNTVTRGKNSVQTATNRKGDGERNERGDDDEESGDKETETVQWSVFAGLRQGAGKKCGQ
jgi:hypothetical protein